LHEDSLKDVRLGIVELHAPGAQMTAAAVGTWDRALGDLRAAGAVVEPFDAAVTRANYTNLFTESARARGDLAPNPKAPAPTANALFHYFLGRARDASDARDMIRRGYAAYRSFYDVLPETFEECEPLFDQPMERDGAGVSFAKSRAEVVAKLAASMKAANVEAMVYPTMPFRAPRAADSWPDVRTPLGYGNWLGLPEVSVPAGVGSDGVPELNLSVVGLPGTDARVLAIAYAYERASRRFVLAR
jgi:aspartyl-tRNA(Asn)/glutamyl-tRNA(Gln) amidotransferase subunit A